MPEVQKCQTEEFIRWNGMRAGGASAPGRPGKASWELQWILSPKLLPCRFAAAKVPLRLVYLQHFLNFIGEMSVDLRQAFGNILVHGAL